MNQYPEVLSVLVVAGGWVLAYFIRRWVVTAVPWINKSSARWGSRTASLISPAFGQVLEIAAFWGILMISLILALSLLGGGELSEWLNRLWSFVSHLLVAFGILAVGHVLGLLARNILSGLLRRTDLAALPRIIHGAIVFVALLVALGHLGLDVSFIRQVGLVIVTVFFAGLALAFALGSKSLVANLSAQGELSHYKIGDPLEVDGIEGTVVEIHRTGVVVSTTAGLARIPAAKFAESTVIVRRKESDDDG
jgi:small-conductance mechanosensitive channel